MKAKSKRREKHQRQSRKVRAEAERVHDHVIAFEQLAGKLIWRFVGKITDEITRSTALLDYQVITKALAAGDPKSKGELDWPLRGMWERYVHHFQDSGAQRAFFAAVESITKRYLGDIILLHAHAALSGRQPQSPELFWDQKLFPRKVAPHLLRQWTSNSAATKNFLISLFNHFADFHSKGSLGRRAILASDAAFDIGWKPQEITKRLVATGDIKLGRHDYKVQTKIAFDRQAATVGRSVLRIRNEVERRRATIALAKRREKAAVRAALKQSTISKNAVKASVGPTESKG